MMNAKVLGFWVVIVILGLMVGNGVFGSGPALFLIPLGLWLWARNDLAKQGK